MFCALLLWEMLLGMGAYRVSRHQHPVLGLIRGQGNLFQFDEGLCWTHRNSLGFRGEEPRAKLPGEYRIALIGNSYVEGMQLIDKETLSAQLTQQLASRGFPRGCSAINCGINGAQPAEYIQFAKFYRSVFQPDYVVVQLYQQDFTYNMFNKNATWYIKKNGNNYVVAKSNQTDMEYIEKVTAKCPSALRWIFLSATATTFAKKYSSSLMEALNSMHNTLHQPAQVNNVSYANEFVPASAVDWTIDQLQKSYPKLIILYIPNIDYFTHAAPHPVEAMLQQACAAHAVDYLNMRDVFEASYTRTHIPAHGFNNTMPGTGHTNAHGDRLIAEQLAYYFAGKIHR